MTLKFPRFKEVHLFSSPDEAPQHYLTFVVWLDRLMAERIQGVHTDNALEFVSIRNELWQ